VPLTWFPGQWQARSRVKLLFFANQVKDADPERHGKGGISKKTGGHMDRQPIALEGGHKRINPRVHSRDDGSKGDCQERDGGHKDTNDLLLIFKFQDQVNQDNGPGEKDQGFIHIGQGDIPISRLVGFDPTEG
jgi:hypothetical protein